MRRSGRTFPVFLSLQAVALQTTSALVVAAALAGRAHAQFTRPPESGGRTISLGQPPIWRWHGGLAAGGLQRGALNHLILRAHIGSSRDLINPVAGVASLGFEAYLGTRTTSIDGGARAILRVPYVGLGVGADLNLRDRQAALMFTARSPVRRGGLLMPGSMLRFDWQPWGSRTFTLGVSAPLRDPLAGRTRPIRDYIVVAADFQPRPEYRVRRPDLDALLDSVRVSAEWIRQLVAPFLDQDGRSAAIALRRSEAYVERLRSHVATRTVDQEIRHFHSQLEHAFTMAAGSSEAGATLVRQARRILLDELILPYNRLLGRKKRKDTLGELATAARGRFSRAVVSAGLVADDCVDAVLSVFQQLTLVMEDVRERAAAEWDDPRLVWLPLQYALLPEEYDEQEEMDALIERATGARFADDNSVLYVANLHFHAELLRSIRETDVYHVLWIHDFPARNAEGSLDWAAVEVVHGYLTTLAQRVAAYDSTGELPSYFIFLDEHYYQEHDSRQLMTILEDPLGAGIPGAAHSLVEAQERLRSAVSESRTLQAESRQYGEAWLRNRIKIHVSITNRPDPSFWSGGLVSSVFGYPDNLMRDHRKIAFRDVSEADPDAGLAILTGMGVGQHYLGPTWEDRSILVRGPALLALKHGARELLLSQGVREQDVPHVLRSDPATGVPAATATSISADTRALMLVNGTGYLAKPLVVAKAVLYSLASPGSVLKIPDSLWNSTFYASLIVGACLRGATASVVAPAPSNAPSSGALPMARAHELFSRLIMVRRQLGDDIRKAGGDLRTGIYALPADTHGFGSRAQVWTQRVAADPALRRTMPFASDLSALVAAAAQDGDGATDTTLHEPPKLHQKVQFFATRSFWNAITGSPEWPAFMTTYLRYRAATYSAASETGSAADHSTELERIAKRMLPPHVAAPGSAYAVVGSQNQDYRGIFMDGEVAVLFGGHEALVPLLDLAFLEGTVDWVTDQAALDRLLPPPGELIRRIARVAKDAL